MTDLRADSMTGEQFVFDERTADPASTEEGERWLRTDLTSGDKIATLRVDVGTSVLDVPVFPIGTAEDSVVEAIRVRVGSQTGYIPAVPETNANFPALRLQHNGQVFGYHDEQGVFAFFDVAISSTNSPVEEGSDLNVDYSVVNTGFSLNNTQDIRLNIDSTEEDRDTNITLSPSSSTTGTLTWTTPSSSAGTYNASVLSDDDTASTSVTVEEFTAIPDSGVSRWGFEGDFTDSWGSNDAAAIGNPQFVTGIAPEGSQAVETDVDDAVDLNILANFADGEAFSFAFWINSTSSHTTDWMFGALETTNFAAIEIGHSSGGLRGIVNDGSNVANIQTSTDIRDGTDTMVTLTYDGVDAVTLYINDSSAGSATQSMGAIQIGYDLFLGARNQGGSVSGNTPGYYDLTDYYDKELSAAEVSDLYNTGSI